MQKYRSKTPLAAVMDKLFRFILACAAGIGWFVCLWGVRLSSLTAGLALGGMFWLCIRTFSKQSTLKREKQMRRMIGGELALNRLLLETPRHAGFQAALWLTPRYPLVMEKTVSWGVLGHLENQKTLVRIIVQHESTTVTAQQIVEIAREMKEHQAEQCLLCLTAPPSKDAVHYVHSSGIRIRLILRADLIRLAGLCSPATDKELAALGRQKRQLNSRHEWIKMIFAPENAKRYFWYGLGMGVLTLATGKIVYSISAAVCLLLFAISKFLSLHHPRDA